MIAQMGTARRGGNESKILESSIWREEGYRYNRRVYEDRLKRDGGIPGRRFVEAVPLKMLDAFSNCSRLVLRRDLGQEITRGSS